MVGRGKMPGMEKYKPFCRRFLLVCVLVLSPAWGGAKSVVWPGWVSWVLDGDTLTFLPQGQKTSVRIRLDGIDAPESCQPGGEAARDALLALVQRQNVELKVWRQDTYGRWVATVYRDGQDVNAAMVRQGWAWAYRFRVGRGPYAQAQRQAQEQRLGVFAAAEAPMAPPVFRRFHGSCRHEDDQAESGWVR